MSQNTTKAKPIKAAGGYNKKSPTENLASANAVHSGIFTDPADYPTPPIDELTFKGAIDTLSTKITAALDGGKKAIADRNHQEQVVIKMMRQLGHYAETTCKDDMPTFLKSGFQAISTVKAAKPALSRWIRKFTPGKVSGQFHIVLVAADGATAYEVRWAPTGKRHAWNMDNATHHQNAPSRHNHGPYAGNELYDSGPFLRRCVRVQRLERSGYPYLYLVG